MAGAEDAVEVDFLSKRSQADKKPSTASPPPGRGCNANKRGLSEDRRRNRGELTTDFAMGMETAGHRRAGSTLECSKTR